MGPNRSLVSLARRPATALPRRLGKEPADLVLSPVRFKLREHPMHVEEAVCTEDLNPGVVVMESA
jgi:hypothetical protein